jgi:hypothetical protein
LPAICADAEPTGCGRTDDARAVWDAIGNLMKLISPDDEVPVERRLEQLGIGRVGNIITEQQVLIGAYQRQIALLTSQVTNQEMVQQRLQSDVSRLLASIEMRPHLIGGRLPALSEITQLKVQIFHTPDLPLKERKAKTEWTLRLTVWINGLRAVEEIKCVKLYSGRRFAQSVHNLIGEVPAETKGVAEQFASEDGEDLLVGMLQARTRGKGTPYIADQLCVLQNHLIDDPQVFVSIADENIKISNFRPAAGSKQGHAKWWGEWAR